MPEIDHRRSSDVHKCLLRLPAEKLEPLLARLALEYREPILQEALKDAPASSASESSDDRDGDDEGKPPRRRPRRALDGDPGVLVPVVRAERDTNVPCWETERRRCWVILHDVRTKVWFDNYAGRDGRRRAWCNCQTHGCGCIRLASHDRNWFATALMLWHLHGLGKTEMSKREHLKLNSHSIISIQGEHLL